MGWMEPGAPTGGSGTWRPPPAGASTRTGRGPRPAILTFPGHCVSQQCGHDPQICGSWKCGPHGHSFKKFFFG